MEKFIIYVLYSFIFSCYNQDNYNNFERKTVLK